MTEDAALANLLASDDGIQNVSNRLAEVVSAQVAIDLRADRDKGIQVDRIIEYTHPGFVKERCDAGA